MVDSRMMKTVIFFESLIKDFSMYKSVNLKPTYLTILSEESLAHIVFTDNVFKY